MRNTQPTLVSSCMPHIIHRLASPSTARSGNGATTVGGCDGLPSVSKSTSAALQRGCSSGRSRKMYQNAAATPVEQLRSRAEAIIAQAGSPTGVTAVSSEAFMGGGSLPDQPLASVAIRFDRARDARKLIRKFRELNPPVIGRIAGDAFFLDLKAIDPSEDQLLSAAIAAVVSQLE